MKSLYVALLTSNRLINHIQKISGINPGFAGQKFNRLIIEGLMKNGIETKAFSSIPMNRSISKKLWWNEKSEVENGISYSYIPFINLPLVHHICLFFYSFFYLLFWGLSKRKEKFVLMDVLNLSICMGSLLACKITGVHCVGVVTDMPGLMVDASEKSDKKKLSFTTRLNKSFISSFDSYVLLTEQMNPVINTKHKPYIIMEGLADSNITILPSVSSKCESEKSILYAGGLHERYGLKMLADAFMRTTNPSYKLIIYGSGPFVQELQEDAKKDSRIDFRGVAPNAEVMKAEYKATILVNPRPTTEEFTLYSFPSKNMEYMSTGTPLLTTCLPGMPKEYHQYVYLFEDETVVGFYEKINFLLSLSEEELSQKGKKAQKWILENKSNIVQTQRIIALVKSNLS